MMILPLVWNLPIDPVSNKDFQKRVTKPITSKDLGGTYLTTGLRQFKLKNNKINITKLKQDLDQWHNPSLKVGESSSDLMKHNFGKGLWLNIGFLEADNWKKAIEEVKKRKLYIFDCWGIIPGLADSENTDKSWASWTISDETHNYLTKSLSKYFLGWDNGENDGRWFWQSMRIYPASVNRKEAYHHFLGWFKPFLSDMKNYVIALCGLTYPHYFAKMDGHRMIGAEFLQALPSVTMWSAWVRGAARQYQMLWIAGISVFNMFGYKTFEEDCFKGDSADREDMGIGNPGGQTGPDRGHSLSLLKRTWYVLFMYGVNIETFEMSQFFRERHLSPLGKLQLDMTSFCVKNEKRRGVQYCPVAVLLDFYSGWVPPRHLYSDSFYTVWGSIPYERGDHQIDLFFRESYPGYQDCAYFRDARGFLTPTPYGDIADVLLSDVRDEILSRYQVVSVLGEISIKDKLLAKLKNYVKKGGKIIWSLPHLSDEAMNLSGITSIGRETKSKESHNLKNDKRYTESLFTFLEANVSNCEVLLETEQGQPLMVKKNFGKGEIITIIVPFGLIDKIKESHPISNADPDRDINTITYHDKPMGTPYQFLQGIKEILFPYLDSFNLVEIMASKYPIKDLKNIERPAPIQYITNITDRPDKLIVTLVNNEPFPVYTLLKVKGADINMAIDLLHKEKELILENGCLPLTLFPSDSADFNIYIIELKVDKPIVQFMKI